MFSLRTQKEQTGVVRFEDRQGKAGASALAPAFMPHGANVSHGIYLSRNTYEMEHATRMHIPNAAAPYQPLFIIFSAASASATDTPLAKTAAVIGFCFIFAINPMVKHLCTFYYSSRLFKY